ncbi:hypothetical protein CUJ84_Chr005034 [Rhizobium leguminosarum]|uniref:Uncharacterized protein n=1 Tax=Rhizobium leguminosarum TaxID=384 RepID=A0A2K9ZAN4_RHILE|nr:hypothetical protein CUJ84_Chr005034 [Rhizobium leguminosarum]
MQRNQSGRGKNAQSSFGHRSILFPFKLLNIHPFKGVAVLDCYTGPHYSATISRAMANLGRSKQYAKAIGFGHDASCRHARRKPSFRLLPTYRLLRRSLIYNF